MDGNRHCYPVSFFIAHSVLTFVPFDSASASICTWLSVFQSYHWKPDFYFWRFTSTFSSISTSYSSENFSNYTDLEFLKCVSVYISKLCNCFCAINILPDMVRITDRCVTWYVIFIVYNFINSSSRPRAHKNFHSYGKIFLCSPSSSLAGGLKWILYSHPSQTLLVATDPPSCQLKKCDPRVSGLFSTMFV